LNSYAALNGGIASTTLPIITGGQEIGGNSLYSQSVFMSSISSGYLLTLASGNGNSSLGIVASHDYAVLGYDSSSQTFTLLNPWGWNTTGTYPGILHLTWAQISANFSHDGDCAV
jgi:hypothetical protein